MRRVALRSWPMMPLILLAAAGCAPLSETTVFYTPAADRVYPPKGKREPVPLLSESPSWPHQVIGRFAMQSDRGYPFVSKALLYNARLQGADAVVVRKVGFDVRQVVNQIPASWENVPQSNVMYQRVQNNQGQWETVPQVYTTYVPLFRPERTVVSEKQWTDVTAEMVVRRGQDARAEPVPAPIAMPR